MQEDADLLHSARKLDQNALNEIFERYAVPLFKYSMRLCGDAVEADDVVGEVFSLFLKQLSIGKGPRENLRSYLYQIAYHKIIDFSRIKKIEKSIGFSEFVDENMMLQNDNEEKEQSAFLNKIIQTELTEDQRNIVILRFIEGFNLQETAAILGKNVGNVKVIQTRAITKIREVMEKNIEAISRPKNE